MHLQAWPVADPAWTVEPRVTMVVQIDGKVRARLEVDPEITEETAHAAALAHPDVVRWLDGRAPARVIVRAPRMVSVVTR